MASYPGAVKTYTNKNPGDVIADSHIDDLQDEVTAIEDGLLNGTARLKSSNSTIANLSVTAGSTFAVRPVEPPPHMAMVFLDSLQDFGSSANSTVLWTAQNILTNSSMHSTGTNPSRLTPQSTGVYSIAAQVSVATPAAESIISLRILDSSNTIMGTQGHASVSIAFSMQAQAYKRFDVLGGYVTLAVVNSAGGSTLSATAGLVSWFSLVKM